MRPKLLVVLLCLFALAGGVYASDTPTRPLLLPLTARARITVYDKDGNVISTREVARYQSSAGDLREVTMRDGKIIQEGCFAHGVGVFTIRRDLGYRLRHTVSPEMLKRHTQADPAELLKHPYYDHTEQFMGHTMYCFRATNIETGVLRAAWCTVPEWAWEVNEIQYAPEGYLLSVRETVSVLEGEPAAEDVRVPDLPEPVNPFERRGR